MTDAVDIPERKRVEESLRESDERFRKLFHGHSAIKLVIDLSTGRIDDANDAAAEFYGWSIEDLKQMRIQQINDLPPDEVDRQMAVAASGPNARFEFRHRRADGTVADVEVFSNRVDIGGRVLLYSIIHDIGERKRAEQAVREARDRLRRAEAFARFGHWEVSLLDRIVHASDGAARIYGVAADEMPLSAVQQLALPEHRPLLDAAFAALIERNEPYDVTFQIRRASDGAVVVVHSRAEYDASRKVVFGVVQDVTERKKIEVERENLILQLQSAAEHIRTLKGILPICSSCKKVRDDKGYWQQVEAYVTRHTEATFTHGICPDCMARLYPDY
jgi:PAS domain S-box-containing protein